MSFVCFASLKKKITNDLKFAIYSINCKLSTQICSFQNGTNTCIMLPDILVFIYKNCLIQTFAKTTISADNLQLEDNLKN